MTPLIPELALCAAVLYRKKIFSSLEHTLRYLAIFLRLPTSPQIASEKVKAEFTHLEARHPLSSQPSCEAIAVAVGFMEFLAGCPSPQDRSEIEAKAIALKNPQQKEMRFMHYNYALHLTLKHLSNLRKPQQRLSKSNSS